MQYVGGSVHMHVHLCVHKSCQTLQYGSCETEAKQSRSAMRPAFNQITTAVLHNLRSAHTGNQMMLSPDEEDLEQLIKGGPFELGLYADKLGSHMFGIDSVAQVCGVCLAHCLLIARLHISAFPVWPLLLLSHNLVSSPPISRFMTVHPTLS